MSKRQETQFIELTLNERDIEFLRHLIWVSLALRGKDCGQGYLHASRSYIALLVWWYFLVLLNNTSCVHSRELSVLV